MTARAGHLKRTFGITEEQYYDMLRAQDNRCAICDRDASEFRTNLAVDHDHVTLEIRGLLCSSCNYRLVGRHRDSDLLRKVADYLDRHTGLFVPKKKRKPRGKRVKSNNS